MDIDIIVLKLQKYPWYMDGGAGKLSRRFNCTKQMIYDAKDIVRGKRVVTKKLPKILVFDIETSPSKAYVWGRWKQNINLPQVISEWFMLSWSAKWLMSDEIMSDVVTVKEVKAEDDSRIVKNLWKLMDEAEIIIAHNAKGFDVPKMNTRFFLAGLPPTSPYTIIDTLDVAKKQFAFSSNKLDALATYLGIENKSDTNFELWVRCLNGEKEALAYMQEYNIKDSAILEEVYLALRPWITAHPNMSLYADDNEQRCCNCGSNNLELTDKFYYTSVAKYPVYRCECGAQSRGRKSVTDKTKNKYTLTSVAK
jgi:hypothetical protein